MKTLLQKILALPQWLLLTALFLIILRLLLPSICLHFINKALSEKLVSYTGHVEDFDLSLYRGAYQLQGLVIQKKQNDQRPTAQSYPPILQIEEIDLSLAWRALLRKEIEADITVDQAFVQLADSKEPSKKQLGTDEKKSHWQNIFDVLIPISIESLKVQKSKIFLVISDLKVKLPIRLEKIEFSAFDLRSKAKNVASTFRLTAEFQGHAPLEIKGVTDILSTPYRADLDFRLTAFKTNTLNKELLYYVPLDVTSGTADVFGEAAMAHNKVKGYLKFFFKDGDIIAPKQKYQGLKHFFFEILGAVGNWILKNNQTKKVAARIPFEYNNGTLNVNSTDVFWSAVKNSYDQLKPNIEESIDLKSVDQ